ncbi:hypothetical protein ACGIF2_15740 [Cellulomonas sp. P22]|uniref:hypothetical protein n=1 Tax=Cellulomonas sp. P22 TaxID=3373189 RepID=UPI00379A9FC4
MDSDGVSPLTTPDVLDLATASGVWAIRSESTAVYYLDLPGLVMRARGPSSQSFPFDDEWVRLVEVISFDPMTGESAANQIRTGWRPRYLTDPRGGAHDYEWRLQRTVTTIEQVAPDAARTLRGLHRPRDDD